jgi:hypothetical protein
MGSAGGLSDDGPRFENRMDVAASFYGGISESKMRSMVANRKAS